jgi:hypothetical protein
LYLSSRAHNPVTAKSRVVVCRTPYSPQVNWTFYWHNPPTVAQ